MKMSFPWILGSRLGATAIMTSLLCCSEASARVVSFEKDANVGVLHSELSAAGFQIQSLQCLDRRCFITMPDSEQKDPMPIVNRHVYMDPEQTRAARVQTAKALHRKLEAGAISPAERDELLKLLVALLLGDELRKP